MRLLRTVGFMSLLTASVPSFGQQPRAEIQAEVQGVLTTRGRPIVNAIVSGCGELFSRSSARRAGCTQPFAVQTDEYGQFSFKQTTGFAPPDAPEINDALASISDRRSRRHQRVRKHPSTCRGPAVLPLRLPRKSSAGSVLGRSGSTVDEVPHVRVEQFLRCLLEHPNPPGVAQHQDTHRMREERGGLL